MAAVTICSDFGAQKNKVWHCFPCFPIYFPGSDAYRNTLIWVNKKHRVGDAIQPYHPLLSPFLPAPNPCQHQSLFQWVNSSHEVARSFNFSIIPSKEIPGLISFRMDWLDLLAVQGTLKSLLQHHSSKASILQHSAFSTVQLSQPYMTTGKTIALTRWTPKPQSNLQINGSWFFIERASHLGSMKFQWNNFANYLAYLCIASYSSPTKP